MPSVKRGLTQRQEIGILVILILLILLPFINKAFHIDDPVRLCHAHQILKSPLQPLDAYLNWTGLPQMMWGYEGNPPLIFYYLALLIRVFGEKEVLLHLSFLVFPLIAGISIYFLAKRFTTYPLIASLFLISTPAFMVMATDLMVDIPFLALCLLAIATYIYGSDKNNKILICLSAILVGLASLTKYVGLALVPLLIIYSLLKKRRPFEIAVLLFFTSLIFGIWCFHNMIYHQELHIFAAGKYLSLGRSALFHKTLGTLSYIGGATIFPLLFIFFLCRKKKDAFLYLFLIGLAILISLKVLLNFKYTPSQIILYLFFASLGLFFCAKSTIRNFWRDSDETFLLLWFWGIFFMNILAEFAAARFVLILIPPLIFLLMRIAEKKDLTQKVYLAGIVLTLMLGLLVSYGDYRYANCYRDFAQKRAVSFKEEGRKVWFRGHWGFQYYMEKEGFEYLAIDRMPTQGDLIIMPSIVHHEPLSKEINKGISLIDTVTYKTSFPFRTMHQKERAGFYSHGYGFLPYAFSKDYLEEFKIYRYEGQSQ